MIFIKTTYADMLSCFENDAARIETCRPSDFLRRFQHGKNLEGPVRLELILSEGIFVLERFIAIRTL